MKRLKKISILFAFVVVIYPQNVLSVRIEETQFSNTRVAGVPLRDASEKPTKPIKQSSFTAQALVWALAFFNAPSVIAKDWSNLPDVRQYYGGTDCSNTRADQIMPAVLCLREGKGLKSCRNEIPTGVAFDLYQFTRHPSTAPDLDPVSMIRWKDHNVCFYTALRAGGQVTEICVYDPKETFPRSVRAVNKDDFRLHEGLERGKSIVHVALDPSMRNGCGTFTTIDAKNHLGPHPTCILSAIAPQGDVTLLCYDPDHPSSLVLKRADGVTLPLHYGSPASLAVTDPGFLMNLGVKLESTDTFQETLRQGWNSFTMWCQGRMADISLPVFTEKESEKI